MRKPPVLRPGVPLEPMPAPILLTKRQVAAMLHVSLDTVARLVKEGALRPVKLGSRTSPLRFRREDVERLARES